MDRDRVGTIVRDREIAEPIVVEVADRDRDGTEVRRRSRAGNDLAHGREGAGAVTQQDQHLAGAAVGRHDVEIAVAVDVALRVGPGVVGSAEHRRVAEGAVAVETKPESLDAAVTLGDHHDAAEVVQPVQAVQRPAGAERALALVVDRHVALHHRSDRG